jgi:hypothetical protein
MTIRKLNIFPCKCYYCDNTEQSYDDLVETPSYYNRISCAKHGDILVVTLYGDYGDTDLIPDPIEDWRVIHVKIGPADDTYPVMLINFECLESEKEQYVHLDRHSGRIDMPFDPDNALNKFKTILTFQ